MSFIFVKLMYLHQTRLDSFGTTYQSSLSYLCATNTLSVVLSFFQMSPLISALYILTRFLHLLGFSYLLPPLGNTYNRQKHIRKFLFRLKQLFVKELLDRVVSHYSCLHVSVLYMQCMNVAFWVGEGRQVVFGVRIQIYTPSHPETERGRDKGEIY